MTKKIAFFEEIDSASYPLVEKHLKKNFTVYSFKIDPKYKKKPKIRKYLENGKLVDASSIIFDYVLYKQAAFYAHENVDNIFYKLFSKSQSIENMKKLLELPAIEDMYKYRLLLELEKIYQIVLKINEIMKRENVEEAYFFPWKNLEVYLDESSPLMTNVQVVRFGNFKLGLKKLKDKIQKSLLLGASLYVFVRKLGGISYKKQRKKFKVGIMIPPNPGDIFGMNYLTETIFVGDECLPKQDVLFIDDSGEINIEGYKKREYNYTQLTRKREIISVDLVWKKIVKRYIPNLIKSVFLSMIEDPFVTKTNASILFDYVTWNIFLDCYEIEHYVKRLLPDNLSKIHILSQHGVKTWFVYPDNTSHDYSLNWDETKKNETLFSFMHFDNAIIYGNIVERFFKKHENRIKKYVKNGVLYSQIVLGLQEGRLKSPIFERLREKKLPGKIIGVFDTTFVDHGYLKVKDGVKFAEDILRLLNEIPNVGIIFKAMKTPELTPPEIELIYQKLRNHERCLFFYMRDKDGISASEVIAVSDLVVSAGYTSTTAEALGAKKKAIYYDVAGRNIGDKYYFNRFPNFVAHSYEELKKLVNYWLYEMTDEEFENFLNTYVKDEIDPYLDGKALTRFKKLLMEE